MKPFLLACCALATLNVCVLCAHAREIAFFYALNADYEAFKAENCVHPLGNPIKILGRSVQHFEVNGNNVYAIKMGSGAVETAISAATLLGRFHCEEAFSLGPVGSLADSPAVGTWVEATKIVPYQKGSWSKNSFEISPVEFSPKGRAASVSGAVIQPGAQAQVTPDEFTPPNVFENVKEVCVASGEVFIASSSYRRELSAETHADVVDMNCFGLATVCSQAAIPLTNWRVISDRADDQAGEDFRHFVESYKGQGGRVLAHVIQQLKPQEDSPEAYPALRKLMEQSPSLEP